MENVYPTDGNVFSIDGNFDPVDGNVDSVAPFVFYWLSAPLRTFPPVLYRVRIYAVVYDGSLPKEYMDCRIFSVCLFHHYKSGQRPEQQT